MSNREEQKEIGYIEALKLLTPREIEVLELIGQGFTYNEAAEKLTLSIHTIHTQVKTIKHKLDIDGYRGLVRWYRENREE